MKKKIVLFISLTILLTSLVGCNNDYDEYDYQVSDSYVTEDEMEQEETIEQFSDKPDYYSFLSKKGEGLYFNISLSEFLDNYNSIKSPYENYDYKDISFDDFFFVERGTDYNGNYVDVYGCTLSIMGKNNDICIMISKDSNDNLTALSLGVQNYNLYTGEARTKILIQYKLLICALGISDTTAQSYITEMSNNLQSYNIFATYDDGLAMYLDTSYPQADYYRINPYTIEQWKNASGLNQISID